MVQITLAEKDIRISGVALQFLNKPKISINGYRQQSIDGVEIHLEGESDPMIISKGEIIMIDYKGPQHKQKFPIEITDIIEVEILHTEFIGRRIGIYNTTCDYSFKMYDVYNLKKTEPVLDKDEFIDPNPIELPF